MVFRRFQVLVQLKFLLHYVPEGRGGGIRQANKVDVVPTTPLLESMAAGIDDDDLVLGAVVKLSRTKDKVDVDRVKRCYDALHGGGELLSHWLLVERDEFVEARVVVVFERELHLLQVVHDTVGFGALWKVRSIEEGKKKR